jgi:NitT/TauT family transport system substrate-binding protein
MKLTPSSLEGALTRPGSSRAHVATWLLLAALALAGCTPAARSTPPPAASPAAPAASPARLEAGAPPAVAAGAPERPALPTTPAVTVKVGTLGNAYYGPYYIAQARGYFEEVGINAEFQNTATALEQLPALVQGQLHVGSCSTHVACFNAISRGSDLRIVGDLSSMGRTDRSRGGGGLVVRKDLWDSGVIREPRDLVGRSVALVAGTGSAVHGHVSRWLLDHDVDPWSVDWITMNFPDQLVAMQNRAIEIGFQTEPLLTTGLSRDVWRVLAPLEEMDPTAQSVYTVYWAGIDRLGPLAGERFMVALLRGVRDYVNAFEYGEDQDAVIDILTRETLLKDPAIYRRIKYSWMDPNGVVNRASLEGYAALFRDLGVATTPIDLSPAFDDKYRAFAVQYLGEYRLR